MFTYSLLVYDPDPISTMRRRRVSNDSVDSGSGDHRSLGHLQRPPQMAPLTSYAASTSQLTPTKKQRTPPGAGAKSSSSGGSANSSAEVKKKHKKRHKHHHCAKHKHKKHGSKAASAKSSPEEGSLRIKLDGSFNNTTTYSIRSPMYPAKGSRSAGADSGARAKDENEDDSTDESSSDDDDETPVTNRMRVLVFL